MQPVHRAALVALAVLLAAVGVGLASSPGDEGSGDVSPPSLVGGKRLQSARCSDWVHAGARERERTVAALKYDASGPTPYGPATTLSAADAHRLFNKTCPQPQAAAFSLYQLYTRSAAFKHAQERLQ